MVNLMMLIVVSYLGFGTKGFDLSPYGPRMCEKMNQGSGENITTFNADNLTCNVINYNQMGRPRRVAKRKLTGKVEFEEECSNSSECAFKNGFCLDGKCECVIGYSYNYSVRHCVESCSVYGDKFSRYKRTGLYDCNVVTQRQVLKSYECVNLCKYNKDIICINVEYSYHSGFCNLCNVSMNLLGSDKLEYGDKGAEAWDLYYRHCQRE